MQFTILSLFCATLLNGGSVEADVKECQDIKSKFLDCTTKAHETFKEQISLGSDGRPDFAARKSCNYMESAIQVIIIIYFSVETFNSILHMRQKSKTPMIGHFQTCGGSLEGECFTHAEIMRMKDSTTESILKQLESSLQEWDSNKCPAVKSHIERLKQGGGEAVFSESRGSSVFSILLEKPFPNLVIYLLFLD